MLARIVKIGQDKIVLKNKSGKFTDVDPSELSFDYKLGDTIEIEKNGDEYYYLPHDASKSSNDIDDFWEDEENPEDARTTKAAPKGKLVGLGGWLTFFIVTTIIGLILGFYRIVGDNLSSTECATLNSNYHGLCDDITPFLTFENIALIVIVVLRLIGLIMLTQRKKSAISFNIVAFAVTIFWNILDLILALSYYSNGRYGLPSNFVSELMTSALPSVLGSTAVCAAWIPYFLKSERVKNTLTE